MPFFIIFIAIPFIEIMIFMMVGDSIGLMSTLMMALGTAIIGGAIVQYQGLHTLAHISDALNRGQIPLTDIFDGMCLIAAGALLITPGFLTDAIGFLLLIPAIRSLLRYVIKRHTRWAGDDFNTDSAAHTKRKSHDTDIIEGTYERLDKKDY